MAKSERLKVAPFLVGLRMKISIVCFDFWVEGCLVVNATLVGFHSQSSRMVLVDGATVTMKKFG
jgi:hypothetical protein